MRRAIKEAEGHDRLPDGHAMMQCSENEATNGKGAWRQQRVLDRRGKSIEGGKFGSRLRPQDVELGGSERALRCLQVGYLR